MAKANLIGLSLEQMGGILSAHGQPSYRGKQLFKWLYHDRVYDFGLMSNFTKTLRQQLADQYRLDHPAIRKRLRSTDGTEKFVFGLEDGREIESVLVELDDHKAVCVSSQVGCALDCKFCATGTMGFVRNLTVGEILSQPMVMRDLYGPEVFRNIVFMGMGEPLNNFDNLLTAIAILTDSLGMGVGAKKIVVSTAGVAPKIRKLADTGLKVRLAISLNAAVQDKRERIMPIARAFDLDSLMSSVRYYAQQTGYRVTFEYILMRGFNDSLDDVLALARLIQGLPCKINLLAYNPVEGLSFERPEDSTVERFAEELYPRAPAVTVRKSRGRDIQAACGQLVARHNS